jgi:acetyl-CoA acetyltransferase
MRLRRPIFVVGGAHTPYIGKGHPNFISKRHVDFGKRENPSIEDHIKDVIAGALESTGADPKLIERGYIGNFLGELFSKQGLLGGAMAASHQDLCGKPFIRTEAACASGAAAVTSCIDSIMAGLDITLAVGAEVECNVRGSDGAEYMARACDYRSERSLDEFVFPFLFAQRTKSYKEAFGADDDDLGRVIVKAYENANLNPYAQMHDQKMSLEDTRVSETNRYFLEEPELKSHIRLNDCTHFSDGASAIILASEDGLEKLGLKKWQCTEIESYGAATAAINAKVDPTRLSTVKQAASIAYAAAKRKPEQIQVAEVHDCFSITELQMYEALGFADDGKGYTLVRQGDTKRDGRIPVNTGGGLLAFGHPVGATGVKQVFEIYRQMKGLCGDYQLQHQPDFGLSANMGGNDRMGIIMLHKNHY